MPQKHVFCNIEQPVAIAAGPVKPSKVTNEKSCAHNISTTSRMDAVGAQYTRGIGEKAITSDSQTQSEAEAEDQSNSIRGTKLTFLTLGLCLAYFVVALDNTIITTAIPRITTQFDSLNDVGWYGSSYLLTSTSLQPLFGKLNTYFSVKWIFLGSLLIFEGMCTSGQVVL